VLLGLLRPDAGWARIFGMDCWREGHRLKAEVGYVPADLRLYPWLTCRNLLRIIGRMRGRDVWSEGEALCADFELELDVPVRHMSRGMRQKLGLVLAMSPQPRLLILDEPSTGLDPLIQDRLYQRLRSLAGRGHTVFFSSHTLSEVEALCDSVGILRAGRLVENATLESLRRRARRTVTITWQDGAAGHGAEPPAFLSGCVRAGVRWEATLTGTTVEMLQWCAGRPVADLAVGRPDLASVFRGYYQAEERLP
jgi:ABC-2 type transport system ATP-binding protein